MFQTLFLSPCKGYLQYRLKGAGMLVLKRDVNLALVLELTIPKILSITCHFQTKSFLLI